MTHPIEHIVDFAALGALAGVLIGALPHVTAVLTFIWVLVRLYETATIQAALKRLKIWRSG
jgi:chromate transport protein ChrA